MAKIESKAVSFRLRNPIREALDELAGQWGCTATAAVERAIVEAHSRLADEDVARNPTSFEAGERPGASGPTVTDPRKIPGVSVGVQNLPRRESAFERAQREAQERERRARARSSIGDDPSFVVDPEFVQE